MSIKFFDCPLEATLKCTLLKWKRKGCLNTMNIEASINFWKHYVLNICKLFDIIMYVIIVMFTRYFQFICIYVLFLKFSICIVHFVQAFLFFEYFYFRKLFYITGSDYNLNISMVFRKFIMIYMTKCKMYFLSFLKLFFFPVSFYVNKIRPCSYLFVPVHG